LDPYEINKDEMMIVDSKQILKEGMTAYTNGQPFDQNPYGLTEELEKAFWSKGWIQQAEIKQIKRKKS